MVFLVCQLFGRWGTDSICDLGCEPAEEESPEDSDDGSYDNVAEVVLSYEDSADAYEGCPSEHYPCVVFADLLV